MKSVLLCMVFCLIGNAVEIRDVANGVVIEKYRIVYREWDKNAVEEMSCGNRYVGIKVKLVDNRQIIIIKKLLDTGKLPDIDQRINIELPNDKGSKVGVINGVDVYDFGVIKTANQSLKGRM